ncbi:MAG TPA: MFS transporter [Synergistaceae bacterium]|nr:MFS transporter [Synergistaceae bacterium]
MSLLSRENRRDHPLVLFPDFRKFFSGRFASAVGDKFFSIALAWWVVNSGSENSSLHLGLLMGITMVPIVLFGPFMGTLADRFHRKKCMIHADILRLLLLLGLSGFLAGGKLSLPLLYVFVFFISLFMPLFEAAANSSLQALTDAKHVTAAAAINATAFQFSTVIGAALGGAALAAVGPLGAFLFNGGTFCVSLVLIASIKADLSPPTRQTSHPAYLKEMGEGLGYLRKNTPVALLLVLFGAFNFFFSPVLLAIPLTVRFTLQAGPLWVGLFEASLATGALLAAIYFSLRPFETPYRRITGGLLTTSLGILLFGLGKYGGVMLGALFLTGLGLGTVNATTPAFFQKVVPDSVKGRFFAILTAICYAVMPLAFVLFGLLNHAIPLWLLIVCNGIGALLLALGMIKIPRIPLEEHCEEI